MTLPPYTTRFVFEHGSGPEWVGTIMTCQYLAGVVGQLAGGYISDRFGVKFTVAAIMFADILTFGATGFVTSNEQMLAIRILAGLFNPSAAANAWMIKVRVAQSIACPDPIRSGSSDIFLQGTTEAQRPKAYGVCSSQRHQSV